MAGRAHEGHEPGVAGLGDHRSVLDGDRVDPVARLHRLAATDGYRDRLGHGERRLMPEYPEMEAGAASRTTPSEPSRSKAGPAHIATLKTFDPPLQALEGRRFEGAERRGKRLLFPTEDDELVLLVHLMTAGRLRFLRAA